MDYIIQNWSELNLIDRAWFVGGAWLLFIFFAGALFQIGKSIKRRCTKN